MVLRFQYCPFVGVTAIAIEPFEISSWKFYGNKLWPKALTTSKVTTFQCTAPRDWWLDVSGVLTFLLMTPTLLFNNKKIRKYSKFNKDLRRGWITGLGLHFFALLRDLYLNGLRVRCCTLYHRARLKREMLLRKRQNKKFNKKKVTLYSSHWWNILFILYLGSLVQNCWQIRSASELCYKKN